MTDLFDFKKGMIVGMQCTGCLVIETANYLGCARITVSALMTAYTKCSKVSPAKYNNGLKRKLSERNKRELTHI